MMNVMNAQEIRTARTAMGMTQRQLAAEIGRSQMIISAYETGRSPVSAKADARIREVMRAHGLLIPAALEKAPEKPKKEKPVSHKEKYRDIPPMVTLYDRKTGKEFPVHDHAKSEDGHEMLLVAEKNMKGKENYRWSIVRKDDSGKKFIRKRGLEIYLMETQPSFWLEIAKEETV